MWNTDDGYEEQNVDVIIFWSLRRFWLVLAVFALIAPTGCSDDYVDGERCPSGASYDEDLDRCVVANADAPDAGDGGGAADASGGDVSNPDTDDTGLDDDTDPSSEPDAGESDTDDAGESDTGSACDDVTCGANAYCGGGDCVCESGYDGDPYDKCFLPPPCDGECPDGSTCLDGECICDPGFATTSDGCELEEVGDPADRTSGEVCQRWNEDPWTLTFDKWAQEPADECDWGWLSEEYHLEAIREVTRYRWLVGLPAVTTDENARETTQACATTLAAENSGLTHDITEDFACYTSEAAAGAGSSNIASGAVSAADTVRRYIEDWNVPSLGHRRWIFNPSMEKTAFGIRNGYSCNYAFNFSGSANPEFTAYPAPGYFPQQALHGKWSFASNQLSLSDDTEVSMTNLADDSDVVVSNVFYHSGAMGWGSRPPMVSWNVGSLPDPGETYEITIEDAYSDGDDLVYETTLVDCSQ